MNIFGEKMMNETPEEKAIRQAAYFKPAAKPTPEENNARIAAMFGLLSGKSLLPGEGDDVVVKSGIITHDAC